MSNKRRLAPVPTLAAPDPPPQQVPMAATVVACIVCGQPSVCSGFQQITPPDVADGAEPTPDEAMAIANGYRFILLLTCQGGHRFQMAFVQQPGQPCLSLLADAEGKVFSVPALQAMQQRQKALAQLIVPGRRH